MKKGEGMSKGIRNRTQDSPQVLDSTGLFLFAVHELLHRIYTRRDNHQPSTVLLAFCLLSCMLHKALNACTSGQNGGRGSGVAADRLLCVLTALLLRFSIPLYLLLHSS
ncbi:hypothetical protein AAFF_G00148460 [Aldrovandia affinis]|uniref:Uncharacterized protein n=1 Tax=Aldrovandia affinis TaxID=143900 RepID=A0AAD7W8L5_9TELE|nr:hypothetical protein AAFF_G00148460 [Aldrovandia affinis]